MKLCGNYNGPNRALPCAVEVNELGKHKGPHTIGPGNHEALSWPQRYAIWEKNDFFQIANVRKDMDPEVVEIGDNLLCTWNFNWQVDPKGKFHDVKVEDGEITGIVSWFDPKDAVHIEEMLVHGDVRFGGYYTKVETRKGGKGEIVTKCMLTGVSLVVSSAMPGAAADIPGPKRLT